GRVVAPRRTAGPVGAGDAVGVEVGEEVVEHGEPAGVVAGHAVFADEALVAGLLEPLDEFLHAINADHGVGAFAVVALVVGAGEVVIEITVGLVDETADGVLGVEVGILPAPAGGVGPAVAGDDDVGGEVHGADGVDGGLGHLGPGAVGGVGLVHDAVAVDGGVALVVVGDATPDVAEGVHGDGAGADEVLGAALFAAGVVVHV